jgi:dUTP pyrophosphatase
MTSSEQPVLKVPFRRLRPGARVPERAYAGDAGYDLAAAENLVLAPGERAVIRTG